MKKTSGYNKTANRREKALQEVITALKKCLPSCEIILFGSQARGDFTPYSDIDLLVLLEHGDINKIKDEIRDFLYEYELKYDLIFNTLIYTKSAWNSLPYKLLPIHTHIETEGVTL
jgi:predicted nucleotidyltransferase